MGAEHQPDRVKRRDEARKLQMEECHLQKAEIVPGDGSNQETIHGWIQKMYGSQDDTHLAFLMH